MTAQSNIVFFAAEPVQITGYERECDCSHCGRPLKVGVKLSGFVGAFGSDCLAKASCKQVVGPYVQRLAGASIRERAIIAGKGAEYARRVYGWQIDGANFRLVLKTPLQSI
jgi:hypothetical protein